MDFELSKRKFINLKKEELNYIDSIAKISSNRLLSEEEKLESLNHIKDIKQDKKHEGDPIIILN